MAAYTWLPLLLQDSAGAGVQSSVHVADRPPSFTALSIQSKHVKQMNTSSQGHRIFIHSSIHVNLLSRVCHMMTVCRHEEGSTRCWLHIRVWHFPTCSTAQRNAYSQHWMLSEVTCSSASCHAVLSWLVPLPPVQGSRQQVIAACEAPNEEAQPDGIFPTYRG